MATVTVFDKPVGTEFNALLSRVEAAEDELILQKQPFNGATSQDSGSAGIVPAPAAGDQDKVLKGGGSWGLPGVVTINGRSPNPLTGDITVIEGGGSSSYGSYRLDAVIATTDWTGSGPYTVVISNQLITANMDGTETWLDDKTAMLGQTTFTTGTGTLTVTTTIKPTAQWSLHVVLAVNGADVLADMSGKTTALQDGIAIIVDGDTASVAVPVGSYAYIKNNTHGLGEGLYINSSSSAFPSTGGTANSTIFTAVSGGGLNGLKTDVSTLSAQIANVTEGNLTKENANISSVEYARYVRNGKIVQVFLNFTVGTTISDSQATLFSGLPETKQYVRYDLLTTSSSPVRARIAVTTTYLVNAYSSGGIQAGTYEGTIVYITK